MLVDWETEYHTVIWSNDIRKLNYHTINSDELAKGIVNIALTGKYYGLDQIAISSILARSNQDLNNIIRQVNFS